MYHITFVVFWPYSLWTTKVNKNMYFHYLFTFIHLNLNFVLYLLVFACAYMQRSEDWQSLLLPSGSWGPCLTASTFSHRAVSLALILYFTSRIYLHSCSCHFYSIEYMSAQKNWFSLQSDSWVNIFNIFLNDLSQIFYLLESKKIR